MINELGYSASWWIRRNGLERKEERIIVFFGGKQQASIRSYPLSVVSFGLSDGELPNYVSLMVSLLISGFSAILSSVY